MAASGVTVAPDCVNKFNELKLGKSLTYIIYKISDNGKEITVEDSGNEREWDVFRKKLVDAKDPKGGIGPRYAVYDAHFSVEGGERSKIVFIAWSPDDASVRPKMLYSSSKDAIRRALPGIAQEVQANDANEIEEQEFMGKVASRVR